MPFNLGNKASPNRITLSSTTWTVIVSSLTASTFWKGRLVEPIRVHNPNTNTIGAEIRVNDGSSAWAVVNEIIASSDTFVIPVGEGPVLANGDKLEIQLSAATVSGLDIQATVEYRK